MKLKNDRKRERRTESDTNVTENRWLESIFVQVCQKCGCVTDIVVKTIKRWRSTLGPAAAAGVWEEEEQEEEATVTSPAGNEQGNSSSTWERHNSTQLWETRSTTTTLCQVFWRPLRWHVVVFSCKRLWTFILKVQHQAGLWEPPVDCVKLWPAVPHLACRVVFFWPKWQHRTSVWAAASIQYHSTNTANLRIFCWNFGRWLRDVINTSLVYCVLNKMKPKCLFALFQMPKFNLAKNAKLNLHPIMKHWSSQVWNQLTNWITW